MRTALRVLGLNLLFLLSSAGSSIGQNNTDYSPFAYLDDVPNVIVLNGEIDFRTPLAFKRALSAHPDTHTIVLNSGGGSVQAALLVAEEIHERGIATVILSEFQCLSACSFIFFAGRQRLAEGKLGVHQMSGSDDIEAAQLNLSDILETLAKYGVPQDVITRMLRTRSSDMYIFSPEEVADLGINKLSSGQQNTPNERVSQATAPEEAPENAAELAKAFVLGLILSGSLPTDDLLELSDNSYAEIVNFYGKQLSKKQVLDEKRHYAERWPIRISSARADTIKSFCSNGLCYVSGIYDWQVSNPKTSKRLTGVATFEYTVSMVGSGYSIIAEAGDVLKRKSK